MGDHIPLYGAATSRFLDAAFNQIITKLNNLYKESEQASTPPRSSRASNQFVEAHIILATS